MNDYEIRGGYVLRYLPCGLVAVVGFFSRFFLGRVGVRIR